MKALIFNSGIGKRMGELTETTHKSMVEIIGENETIFERQLRLLSECGINEVVVTTGPFPKQLESVMNKDKFSHMKFVTVPNEKYKTTNYIYSMYLARAELHDDIVMLHGDLVFNRELLVKLLEMDAPSVATVNKKLPKPEKDFKARLYGEYIIEVGVNIFDDDCYAFQPLYKLSERDFNMWMTRVESFIASGRDSVYAENALNEITDKVKIKMLSYEDDFIDEIDNQDDLKRVSDLIKEY